MEVQHAGMRISTSIWPSFALSSLQFNLLAVSWALNTSDRRLVDVRIQVVRTNRPLALDVLRAFVFSAGVSLPEKDSHDTTFCFDQCFFFKSMTRCRLSACLSVGARQSIR